MPKNRAFGQETGAKKVPLSLRKTKQNKREENKTIQVLSKPEQAIHAKMLATSHISVLDIVRPSTASLRGVSQRTINVCVGDVLTARHKHALDNSLYGNMPQRSGINN